MKTKHASFHVEQVRQTLATFDIESVKIPERTTHLLQPLDVAVNKSFKDAMRREWQEWYEKSDVKLTAKGNRQKPSYQEWVNMVSAAVGAIKPESIISGFRSCGLTSCAVDDYHASLKRVMMTPVASGLQEAPDDIADLLDISDAYMSDYENSELRECAVDESTEESENEEFGSQELLFPYDDDDVCNL
jgi:predicted alpha/beta hydrolase family esterase